MVLPLLIVASMMGTVELRGGGVVDSIVEDVSIAGVRVGGTAPRTLSWDRVRRVQGDFAAAAQEFSELSDNAWRARTRLDRGDVHGALEMLADLENQCAGQIGATPLVVFSTAFNAHLRAGQQPEALRAFFELHRLIEDDSEWPRHGLDAATGLSPVLPPFFAQAHTSESMSILAPNTSDSPELERLRASFAAAAIADVSRLPAGGPKSAAELFLNRIARTVSGDEQGLQELQTWARDHDDEPDSAWRAAWVHAAAARAMLGSDEPSIVRQGAVEFLHVPALSAGEASYLAGVAFAEAANALASLGETSPASILRAELARISPDHPALARRASGATSP